MDFGIFSNAVIKKYSSSALLFCRIYDINPFFKVELGIGENENNDYEGVKYKNFYGTHVSGPILARNPELLEKMVVGFLGIQIRKQ